MYLMKVRVYFLFPIFPAPFVEETVFSLLGGLQTFMGHLTMYVSFIVALSVLFHWPMSVFMPVPCYFDYSSLIICFEIRKM